MRAILLALINLSFCLANGQNRLDSLLKAPVRQLALEVKAERIRVDGEGNIFLLSPEKRQIYKLLFASNYDSLIFLGGASAREDGLLHPIDIRSKNRQRIYVLDDASRKLILFNTNLKVLQSFDFLSLSDDIESNDEVFPIAFDLSPTGELFVLNQWDNQILRFSNQLNPNGKFGGTNYGEGSLFDPIYLEVDDKQFIHVWDREPQAILVYSLYGILEYRIDLPESWKGDDFQILGEYILSHYKNALHIYHKPTRSFRQLDLSPLPPVIDLAANRQHFYFLTTKGIYIYPRSD